MYHTIKSKKDIAYFLEKTNSLHDGYIIGVRYEHNGISRLEHGHFFDPQQTKLVVKILVTSILDAVVELEFENLLEWQIKENQCDMTDTTLMFYDRDWIVWSDDVYVSMDEVKKGSYVIAKSMRWRMIENT